MTTFGDTVYQNGGAPVSGPVTLGKTLWVCPRTGSDAYAGTDSNQPLASLSKALTLATANQNDVVYLISQGNAAADTTSYQSVALDWNKDGVWLIGVCSGNNISQRSRIAQLSTATNIDGLFTVSANNCYIANISVFQGVADATSVGCVLVTGDRNHFYNCSFQGIGNNTMDVANNYSLALDSGAENLFEGCTIGLDTIARGTGDNSEIRFLNGAVRNTFKDCLILTYAEAATHQFVTVLVDGLDRFTLFKDCSFINMPTGTASGTTMTEAFDITGGGSPDGLILLKNCTLVGATDWEASGESAKLWIDGAAPTNNTSGLAVLVEAT